MLNKLEELKDSKLYDEVKVKNDVTEPFDEYVTKRKKLNKLPAKDADSLLPAAAYHCLDYFFYQIKILKRHIF